MPNSTDPRDPAASPFTHPVDEALSRYLGIATPGQPRAWVDPRTPCSPGHAGYDTLVQMRAEELWDSLADFA